MNILGVLNMILYPLFVYVLFFSKWILVESNPTLGGSNPSFGSANKTGVDLSLKAKEATNEFNYNKSGNIVTYTAKDNYAFKSVKTGNKGETVVWATTNANEYATKVVLDGKGKKKKKVTIHLPNGTNKVFNRENKNKPWTKVSQQSNQANGQQSSVTSASGTTPADGTSQSANEGTRGGGALLSQANEGSRTHTGTGSAQATTPPANLSGSPATTPRSSDGDGTSHGGGGTDKSGDGSGATHTGGDGNGGGTTPPANEGNDNDSSAEGDGSSATNPPSSGGEGTQELDPADSPNDLMKQFEKLVGDKLEPDKYPNDFKFFKAEPNDANNPVELTKSEYKIKKFAEEHLYVFYDLNCTLIKHKDKEVWKYDSSKNNAKYPKGMNVEPDLMLIYFGEYTEFCVKRSDEWKQSRTESKDLSKLKVMADSKERN